MTAPSRADSDSAVKIAAGRVAFAALHHPDYRKYFVVIMLAQMGDNIEHVIS
jgi:hypothetical protein